MLIDMDRRSAVGWPGQLLRLPLRRWPGQLFSMLRRRRQRDATVAEPGNEANLRTTIGQALGAQGRSDIADAIDLTRWLQRGH